MYFDILFSVLIIITGHISPALLVFNFPLTCYPLLLFIPIVYLRHKNEYSFIVFERIFILLLTASILFLFSSGTHLYFNHFKHIVQTFYSFLGGFSLFVLYKNLDKTKNLKKVIFYIILGLLFLGLLERFIPSYRNLVLQINRFILSNNRYNVLDSVQDSNRSIALIGFVRPLVFSPENSILGRTIFCLASSLILLLEKFKERIIFGIFMTSTFLIFGSPSCLLILPCALLSEFFIENNNNNNFKRFFIPFFLSGSVIVSFNFLRVRIENLVELVNQNNVPFVYLIRHSSEYIRIVLPIQSIKVTLDKNPFFGIGYGAHNHLQQIFFGRDIYGTAAFNGNNLLYPLIAFGLFGSIIFTLIIIKNFPKRFKNILPMLPYLILYSIYSGGFPEPRFWIFFFSILSTGYLSAIKARENNEKIYYKYEKNTL